MSTNLNQGFYVVAYEPGAEHPALPTWANKSENPASLALSYPQEMIERQEIITVPGAYKLVNVLSVDECQRLIDLTEALGYLPDAAVSLPREIRHNDNVVWVTDAKTDDIIWQRVAHFALQNLDIFQHKQPVGLNARFRFYRYREGDYFRAHTDGAWPGSRVVDGQLITNAYSDRYSLMTFLIFLNDDFEGGTTRFQVAQAETESRDANLLVDVRVPKGGVLCFPHGLHPLHCVHSSEPVRKGIKYIIRTDMLFEL